MKKLYIDAKDLLSNMELSEIKAGENKDKPKDDCTVCTTCVACATDCVTCTNNVV